MSKLREAIEAAASDMGFDGPEAAENLLEFLRGAGLGVHLLAERPKKTRKVSK